MGRSIGHARQRLMECVLAVRQGGSEISDRNLRVVLDALWDVSRIMGTKHYIEKKLFKNELIFFEKHIEALEARECVDRVPGGLGAAIRIKLLSETISGLKQAAELDCFQSERPPVSLQPSELAPCDDALKLPSHATKRARLERYEQTRQGDLFGFEKTKGPFLAYVFVDVPNLLCGQHGGAELIDWSALKSVCLQSADNMVAKKLYAYLTLPKDLFFRKAEFVWQRWKVLTTLAAAGFEPRWRDDGKDIDTLMLTEMLDPAVIEFSEQAPRIALVLVTGDKDYIPAVQQLRRRAEEKNVELQVAIVTWKESISEQWEVIADKVAFINSMPGCIGFSPQEIQKRAERGKVQSSEKETAQKPLEKKGACSGEELPSLEL